MTFEFAHCAARRFVTAMATATATAIANATAILLVVATVSGAQERLLQQNNGPGGLAMGTIRGEKGKRVVIRGATVISGRGTPGSNRGMPPEGDRKSVV